VLLKTLGRTGQVQLEANMTTTLRALAIAATLAAGASPFLAPGGGLMAPAHAKKDKGPGFVPETFLNAAPVATGAVRRFLVNPHGEVDGLQLVDGTIVKFPPHMGQELTAAVKAADTVSVRGFREAIDVVKALVVTNEASKQQVVEHPPVPDIGKMPKHLRFATLSRLKITGKVERPMRGKQGEVNGVLLEDGTVVHFPPHAAFDFAALLQPGQTLAAEGLGSETAFGRGLEATALGPALDTLRPIYDR
jgi:hypothetical protein